MAASQAVVKKLDTATPRGKFIYLFFAQVILIVLVPMFVQPGLSLVVFRFVGTVVLFSGVYAVSDRRSHWVVAVMLAVPAGVMNAAAAFGSGSPMVVPGLVFTIAFLAFTLVTLLRIVVRTETVTSDTIYGALSAYLLMALTWGVSYFLLETIHPGTLRVDQTRHAGHVVDWFDCVFYSFITLTSTGYGDIVPMSPQARSLSMLEAVTGIMYVAVLVARLVGLYTAGQQNYRSTLDQF